MVAPLMSKRTGAQSEEVRTTPTAGQLMEMEWKFESGA